MKILVLSPHTDDGECGVGGTIAKLIEENHEVYYVVFSLARKSIPKGFPKNATKKEVLQATSKLGIDRAHLIMFDFEVRDFPVFRQDILEKLTVLQGEISPDRVFLPSPNDTHQDHYVISSEGFRAFKRTTILGYEVPWNNLSFNTNVFVFLEERHIQKKVQAVGCYLTQKVRIYGGTEFLVHLAKVRGAQIGAEYAECFEAIRWVIN